VRPPVAKANKRLDLELMTKSLRCHVIVLPDRVNQAVDESMRRGVRIEIYKTITKPAIVAADV
jgi:hypothetical protein